MVSSRRLPFVAFLVAVATVIAAGCGGKAPPIYPITGKVMLGGKPHNRLLMYFRPADGKVTEFTIAVGETDKDGNLQVRSSSGEGLAAGEYKVTFSAPVSKAGESFGASDKPDEQKGAVVIERVPPPYDDKTSQDTTPVRFTVKAGEPNVFEFDVPVKK